MLLLGAGLFCCCVLAVALVGTPLPAALGAMVTLGFVAGLVLIQIGQRRLHEHLTGQRLRQWPNGFPSFQTQVKSASPRVLGSAAQTVGLPPGLTVVAIYLALAIGVLAFAARAAF